MLIFGGRLEYALQKLGGFFSFSFFFGGGREDGGHDNENGSLGHDELICHM